MVAQLTGAFEVDATGDWSILKFHPVLDAAAMCKAVFALIERFGRVPIFRLE
jgi:hypothetical protein